LGHILALARKYDTSRESTARRYVELQDEPCATVISQNGKSPALLPAQKVSLCDREAERSRSGVSIAASDGLQLGETSD
jgi:hypothetical protein